MSGYFRMLFKSLEISLPLCKCQVMACSRNRPNFYLCPQPSHSGTLTYNKEMTILCTRLTLSLLFDSVFQSNNKTGEHIISKSTLVEQNSYDVYTFHPLSIEGTYV